MKHASSLIVKLSFLPGKTRTGRRDGVSRRAFLGTAAGLAASAGILGAGWAAAVQNESALQKELDETNSEQAKILKSLDGYVAYGGGTNLKLMPDPKTGLPTIPMEEVWHFDLDRAFCRVDSNPQAFAMETYKMGRVVIDANSFQMVMLTKDVQVPEFTVTPDGAAMVKLTGEIDCSTVASVANTKVGGRDIVEPAPFEIAAVHDEKAGDNFAFTVFFDSDKAPVNYAIFGPKAAFTGKIQSGGVTIKSIKDLASTR